MNEYNGLDIRDKIKEETYRLVFAIGNHHYSDYNGLKLIVQTIIKIESDKMSMIIESLCDLELRPLEKRNIHASKGYNKRIHDYFSLVCALNDCGYNFNSEIFSANMFKIRGNLIVKSGCGLDIMIDNPIKFNYEKIINHVAPSNKVLNSSEKINGLELCNLMFYIGSNKYDKAEDVLKHGNFVKNKEYMKILKQN